MNEVTAIFPFAACPLWATVYIRVFSDCWNSSRHQGFAKNECKRLSKFISKFFNKSSWDVISGPHALPVFRLNSFLQTSCGKIVGGTSDDGRYAGSEDVASGGMSALTDVKKVFRVKTNSLSDKLFPSRLN